MVKMFILAALAWVVGATPLHAQSVRERGGNIEYVGRDGVARMLTRDGNFFLPTLSPDGRTVAFIHIEDREPIGERHEKPSSLWIADGPTGTARVLFASRYAENERDNMETMGRPIFSLDGSLVYVSVTTGWRSSVAVHRISVATGQESYVIDGYAGKVIRTGRLRGSLLVNRHRYRPAPHYTSILPIDVVSPDATQTFMVPGTADGGDSADRAVARWLRLRNWQAW